jgi:hypothetical protein
VRWGSSDSSSADEGRPGKTGGLKTAAAVSNYPARVLFCFIGWGDLSYIAERAVLLPEASSHA